jgi:hypothetical protein
MVTIDEPLTPKMPSPAATSAGSPCRTNGSQAHPPLGPRTVRFDRETDNEISGTPPDRGTPHVEIVCSV